MGRCCIQIHERRHNITLFEIQYKDIFASIVHENKTNTCYKENNKDNE